MRRFLHLDARERERRVARLARPAALAAAALAAALAAAAALAVAASRAAVEQVDEPLEMTSSCKDRASNTTRAGNRRVHERAPLAGRRAGRASRS